MSLHKYEKLPGHQENLRDSDADFSDSEAGLPRTSDDIRRHDLETITAEEEAERLLADNEKTGGGGSANTHNGDKRLSLRRRRQGSWRSSRSEEEGERVDKVEDGDRPSSSVNSSEEDVSRLRSTQMNHQSKLARIGKFTLLHILIISAFFAFAYGAYRATLFTTAKSKSTYAAKTLSNGTHDFAPTTILISLDGFRADFLHRGLTPTLKSFMQQGVSPRYMTPSFPSLTFPNHFTLVTGLYPESHGIVGNTFWDPDMQKEFNYGDHKLSMQPEFWNAEPVWETAEMQGLRTAIHMWPGSEAHLPPIEPAYVDKFNADEKLDFKVNRILGWLDLPGPNDPGASDTSPRPQLIAAYVPNVDSDGHKYGPNSTYIRSTIAEVDGMLGKLFKGIEERNLTKVVNIVVVSDHGMATTSNHRIIQLENFLDPSLIEHVDGWPLYGLRPFDQSESHLNELYTNISAKIGQIPNAIGNLDVYLRDENMPSRFNFRSNPRIAPLWIVPKAGYAIAPRKEFDLQIALDRGDIYAPRGLHGYDHEHPLMRAIFVARGPAFPHRPGSRLKPFQNTEVYNILCDSLGISPRSNNGTLRLPLEPHGMHDFEEYVPLPDEEPPIQHYDRPVIGIPPPTVTVGGEGEQNEKENENESGSFNPPTPGEVAAEVPTNQADGTLDGIEAGSSSWRDWINGKIQDVKTWLSGVLGEEKGKETKIEEDGKDGETRM